jgi:hypothetical protein
VGGGGVDVGSSVISTRLRESAGCEAFVKIRAVRSLMTHSACHVLALGYAGYACGERLAKDLHRGLALLHSPRPYSDYI